MKKADLHIHTVATVRDHEFTFSMEGLKHYVQDNSLDVIAITNHNVFDREQYETITETFSIPVFPGIEVDVENGHLLVIAEPSDLDDFCMKCAQVYSANGSSPQSSITEGKFVSIFRDLNKYLLIPHYDKAPTLSLSLIPNIRQYITCGEVSSKKKFISMRKTDNVLVPVLFSDLRASDPVEGAYDRQTYFDIDEISLSSIKHALMDSAKVSLSPGDGHTLLEVTDDGLKISTGLTVVLGKRSSGKSYTLSRINDQFDNAKYIRQFALLSTDVDADKRRFDEILRTRGDSITESFLAPFKAVVDDVIEIDLNQDENEIENYLKALKKAASEAERQDVFSKCKMYQETKFISKDLTSLEELVKAVDLLLENKEYKDIILNHLRKDDLLRLAIDLRKRYMLEHSLERKKQYVNDIVESIKKELQVRSSNTPIPDINFYGIYLHKKKVGKFEEVSRLLKQERIIECKNLFSFKVIAKASPYSGAQALQRRSRSKLIFSDIYSNYDKPYQYLQGLKSKTELSPTEYYKFFTNISYEVLNQYGTPASGGERSEYNLLQELTDAARSQILILDEPESSFDNMFLKDGVNALLKELSKQIPVVIATHNSTIGASVHPDYLIYTSKRAVEDGTVKYELFFGYPSSAELVDIEGHTISRRDKVLDCLEAGEPAYIDRRNSYEILAH